ncbi:hypothetical protein P618_201025 [Holospora obtusa F1]|uniref:Tc1-like transposase DDE domain-containing protein n=1 Tax=Holospora obtusa F1 TaxID=1399147 RepID=W6TD38_HOLOB|nr:transposase [Holospora obtusa]ETZ06808.1 hypothetical protein P618_201025 [Holospora obtusa F1]
MLRKNSYCSGFTNKAVIAPMVFNGSCNTQLFEAWVAQFLIKKLKPGQVVIINNASFHKSKRIREFIESAGCRGHHLIHLF